MSTTLANKTRLKPLQFSDRTYIMGILNVTPDSFSDGGRYVDVEAAVRHAKQMITDGADLIDIGGESTRPGHTKVEVGEELNRVIPVIEAVSAQVDVPISIDTYKAEVAEKAIKAGASIINDVWGAKADPSMAHVAAKYGVPIILMHNRDNEDYTDLMAEMIADLEESISLCKQAGVKDENIILDPGIGFAKTYEHNLEAMRRLDELTALPYPVLLGTSRKSLIAKTLHLPVDDRVEGTGATVCYGIAKGCNIVRVHDVKEMSRMAKMMDAMMGKGRDIGG
ncbi:dihydropteroate synthase [Halalkalibacterium halodurans]|uniref:Dihydropteroate synthase n=1 Tax=Halalkalibacterium halodurans (strain ATCC BAA-125 / DSM 18197 / FERM 7344 / JCM 9153 / C-125) TaxID=272558 RepID=Q9KGG9_HALH5|nr:dihydropteroate synthase [Halalkalibacterium halodurans]MED4080445.1 dihydropteroate synthase [Halalkalibacterium halodurans]MED4085578.1 dihydropteroate synthase [Halalkalibacterium halodurans]MED4104100.1 dihydropteroate synthase [Halalkalibacterium halodurans]MED4107654.1 dihydropteroate synthase [Halalkalibacterium halodurans]MED4123777.1 dihydropteroate synthase [Halalkalibacterium halodurans]